MRVIAGSLKGRSLKAVPGMSTRPTTDKVKESIFNMIGPFFNGGTALDLFAGSGGLGIEAISRGFERCIFVDREYKAIQTIKTNVSQFNIQDRAEIFRNDATRALQVLAKKESVFDGIFLDPPYKAQKLEALLLIIDKHNLLSAEGFIVAEHAKEVSLSHTIGNLQQVRNEAYGVTGVSIYKKEREPE
ncbi:MULTISPECIES: 16S rRNA (guanine(966)-N(2))-methyltransferase RsmD [Bacillus]|uniref:16S rRNA (Guanine(966)-N(2))-methyltransferase RsmD n=2 Tax=Bacillus TaxID=1386 RepID=A0A0M4FVX9_9BACI|nr:hypothetical protein AM592_04615 [Bacillus gobiensis]MBP1079898.1 16S rRNA (guanine(966)-N(2))-methyltransferase RsmD [Bacillus capparidis]